MYNFKSGIAQIDQGFGGFEAETNFLVLAPPMSLAEDLAYALTKPQALKRARDHIQLIREKRLPMVIAANKSDLPGTMSDSEIRKGLDLPKDVPLFFISAKRKTDVRLVLESLVDYITQYTN